MGSGSSGGSKGSGFSGRDGGDFDEGDFGNDCSNYRGGEDELMIIFDLKGIKAGEEAQKHDCKESHSDSSAENNITYNAHSLEDNLLYLFTYYTYSLEDAENIT